MIHDFQILPRRGRGTALLIWMLAAPVAAQPVSVPPRSVALNWVIIKANAPEGRLRLPKKGFSLIAIAKPTELVAVDGPVVRESGKSTIPASTVFARSMVGKGVICEPARRIGQGSIACLADSDGDGRYDQVSSVEAKIYSYNSIESIGYLAGKMTTSRWVELAQPVSASPVRADTPTEVMDIRLRLIWLSTPPKKAANFSVCAQRNEGKTIWGGPILMDYCTAMLNFAPEGPESNPFVGKSTITLHGVDEKGAEISISGLNVGDALFSPD